MAPLPPGVERTGNVMVKDLVTITDPELVRKIAVHEDMARPGEVDIPFMFRLYFLATKFVHPASDRYVLPLEGDNRNDAPTRHAVVKAQLENGFTEEQVARLAECVKSDMPWEELAVVCVKVVGQLILPLGEGDEVPDEICHAAFSTLTDFSELFNPFKYLKGRRSRKMVEDYCASLLPEEEHIGDYAHNLGAAAQGMAKALVSLREYTGNDVTQYYKDNPITDISMRIARRDTTLGGLFPEDEPLLASQSVVVLNILEAAKESQDDNFIFGTGHDFRQCPFKGLFFSTAADIHRRNKSSS